MSRTQRFGLLGVAAIVVIVAFLALRPEDAATPVATSNATRSPVTTAPPDSAASTPAVSPPPKRAPKPSPGPVLVAGTVERLRVTKGERVRFRVRSETADELHVHGYEIRRDLAPGKTVSVSFQARIEGVFEVELEGAGEQVAALRVDP